MTRTIDFSALRRTLLTLPAALALWSVPALAADEDTQLWFYLNAVVPVDEAATATFELSPRFREGSNLLQTRATVEMPVSEWASAGAGGAYIEFAGGRELRAHQQLTLAAGRFTFRTRLEERFFEGRPRAQVRLRQRVATSFPLAERTSLVGTAELLYIARTERPQDEARVDSWRLNATLQQRLSPRLTAGLGYLLLLSPREGAPDRISHVPQVTLVFRP